jgi:hypothetical protein
LQEVADKSIAVEEPLVSPQHIAEGLKGSFPGWPQSGNSSQMLVMDQRQDWFG